MTKSIVRVSWLAVVGSFVTLSACGGSDESASPAASSTAGSGGASAGSGGSATAGSGGTATAGSGGSATAGSGGAATAGSGGTAAGGAGGSVPGNKTIKAADGGTVTADGLTVEIPPGALMADTEITVTVSDGSSSPDPSTLVAKVYDLGPDGTMFQKPVKLTIDFDAAKLGTKIATVSYVAAGKWVALSDSATTGAKVSATTTHFTQFGVVGAEAAACIAMAKADCKTCCKATFPSGEAKVIPNILQKCGCDAGSPCNAQCAANACMAMPISTDCQTCMSAEGSKSSSACFNAGVAACTAQPDCNAYTLCAVNCK